MDDNVKQDEENVEPTQVEEPTEQTEEVAEEQPEAVEEKVEETPEEKKEVPDEEPSDTESADYFADYVNRTNADDLPQFKVGEDGTVDLNELNNWGKTVVQKAQAESARQFAAMREEDRQWNKVFEQYPEVKENKKLRDQIHKLRIGNVYAGGKNDVYKAAKDLLEFRDKGKAEGAEQAQVSIKRQKEADLETASTPTNTSASNQSKYLDLMHSRSRRVADEAQQALLKEMIEKGQI